MLSAILIAAHLLTLGTAAPAPAAQEVDQGLFKRFDPGWCTFHLHNDWSNALDTNPTNKIFIQMFDGNGNNWWNLTQTDVRDALPYSFMPLDFPDYISVDKGVNEGWAFTYKGDKWQTTDDSGRCSTGKIADPGSDGNGGRWTKDYDCGFTC